MKKENEPTDLVLCPNSKEDIYIHPELAKQLETLIRDLRLENKIVIVDGYRTQNDQEELWEYSVEKHGLDYTKEYVAVPGCSEHQTGLAVDIGLKGKIHDLIAPGFRKGKVVECFLKHMKDYGFILRYPEGKKEVTGIGYEPWHFRYVGAPHSRIIHDQGWTLEEYIRFIEQTGRAI
ncbi:hypothetical protein RV02_GL002992 [Enterococcus gilvus]|nr:hypothetical protein RV02_GL002992 [Enterococcus gilvus]